MQEYKLSSEAVAGNDEVTQYLSGEAPSSIYEIVKFGLTNKEGNFTYIILKLQSDYNLAYNGMIFLLCLFSLFVVYSVFSISVSKRTSEYGMLQTLGISEAQIGGAETGLSIADHTLAEGANAAKFFVSVDPKSRIIRTKKLSA